MMASLLTAALAFCVCLVATPAIRLICLSLQIVDRPDQQRKLHKQNIPLGGGVAILMAVAVTVCATTIYGPGQHALSSDPRYLVCLAVAAVIICLVGLLDDRYGLRGRQKLFGQIIAASILIGGGLLIETIHVFHWRLELGLLAAPFTMLWLLGACNAINLLDGSDGLASSVGIVLSLAFAGMAFMAGHEADALFAVALAGALAGFLVYNFPPASIFLGDAGSMLIGLVLGTLAIRSSLKGPATIALAAPAAIWAVPIFDAAMAILRRKLTGRSIYTTDRGHLHHSLLRRGYSGPKTVAVVGIFCCFTAVGALLSVYGRNEMLAVIAVAIVLCTLVLCRLFGHHECLLLLRRMKSFLVSLISLRRHSDRREPVFARLQGDGAWDELWHTLTKYADHFDLNVIQLNVHLPAINEEYHATWKRKHIADDADLCSTDIPLVAHDTTVGRLKIVGPCMDASFTDWMSDLAVGLKPFEDQLSQLLRDQVLAFTAETPSTNTLSSEEGLAAPLVVGKPIVPEVATAEEF